MRWSVNERMHEVRFDGAEVTEGAHVRWTNWMTDATPGSAPIAYGSGEGIVYHVGPDQIQVLPDCRETRKTLHEEWYADSSDHFTAQMMSFNFSDDPEVVAVWQHVEGNLEVVWNPYDEDEA